MCLLPERVLGAEMNNGEGKCIVTGSVWLKSLTDAAAPATRSVLARQIGLCESPKAQNSSKDILWT